MRETPQPSEQGTSPTKPLAVEFLADELWQVIDPKGKLSQKEKALLLGVPESTLSFLCNRRREPNAEFMRAVKRVTGRRNIERFFQFNTETPTAEAA